MMSKAFKVAIDKIMDTHNLSYEEAVLNLADSLNKEGLKTSSEALLRQAKLPTSDSKPNGQK